MPYAERLAESYLAAKEAERNNGTAGEDPLFKLIAGDSKEFVGGIPKETWDGMNPDERNRLVQLPRPIPTLIRATSGAVVGAPMAVAGTALGVAAGTAAGGAIGGAPGALVGAGVGGIAGGTAGGSFGGTLGTEIADHYIDKYNKNAGPPATGTRQDLSREYEAAKGRD